MEELEKGVQRWIVDITKWNPSPNHFSFILSFLPLHEHSSITRFLKMEDRKRALVSRLLQYALVHQVLGIPFDEIIIRRTVEGKPYLECDNLRQKLTNFNFNTSHSGDYVAIASEPVFLVGLDIVYHSIPQNESVEEYVQSFSSYFSDLEWSDIVEADSSSEVLNRFYRYWCLKEAYSKAIGSGLGCKFDAVEFHHTGWNDIFLKVDGNKLKDWRFWLLELDEYHTVTISRGHPRSATECYKKTLKQTELSEKMYRLGLNLPNIPFMFRRVEDLLPASLGGAGGLHNGTRLKDIIVQDEIDKQQTSS